MKNKIRENSLIPTKTDKLNVTVTIHKADYEEKMNNFTQMEQTDIGRNATA